MQTFIESIIVLFLKFVFWFRYRITVKGLEKLTPEVLNKPGGVLFLPNHPAVFVDPANVVIGTWPKFRIRPIIVEYMYYLPVVNWVMKFIRALPVPDFETSSNTIKRKRGERVIKEMIKGLKNGDNFLIYPAGRTKLSAKEDLGGASAVHSILSESPDTNIVLVRVKGLWGSTFSTAFEGNTPDLSQTLFKGVKTVLKNLIFFTPRRRVEFEFVPAPADFPYQASRKDLNRWLEKWYNKPDGLTKQEGEYPGDSLMLVSYSFWREDIPELYQPEEIEEEVVELEEIGDEVQRKVYAKLSELTEIDVGKLKPQMTLSIDLGMDSLDMAELTAFLNEQFDVGQVPVKELKTVGRVLGIASKQVKVEAADEEEEGEVKGWKIEGERYITQLAHGEAIPEVFLNNCERMGNRPAVADLRSGVVAYPRAKLGVLILAEYIRTLPGKYVGIMLPASVGSYLTVLATQLAGKIPLMVNWTQGRRHLEQIVEISNVQTVLSSWAFLERLDNVDLNGVDEKLIMLETVRSEFSIFDKLKALIRSKRGTRAILKIFGTDKLTKDDEAVLLFTSGTESMPKGVPLTHENILSNMRDAFKVLDIYSDDVLFGILPPFHSFGFTTTGVMGMLAGVRTAYSPNPTDGPAMAKAFERWGVTIMVGAPTFIRTLLNASKPEQLKSMRLCVTGAEKAPKELFDQMAKFGKEQCVIEGYGVTECSPILTANRVGKPRKGVGAPIPSVEILIVNPDTMEPVPTDERGLVLARGPNVFSGYVNPGVASPFVEVVGKKWYNTGDLGYLDDQGRLTLSGRKKRFVKVGGEMVSLPAIEDVLLKSAPQKGWKLPEEGPPLAVLGKEDEGEKTKMILVATFNADLDDVNQTIRDSGMSNLIKMAEVVHVPEIPIMGTGKIHYRKLEEEHMK